jgi:hypothetical protein
MKRTCIASLCIAVFVAHDAANAQENGSVKSDEFAKSKLCQLVAQPVGKQVEAQPGSASGDRLRATDDLEPQESAELAAADLQIPPDSPGALQPPAKEAAAILELGTEPARSLSGSGWSLSPTVAAEVTPIENWLELEFGVTATFSHRSTEWDTDLLFKKPWTLSKKVEFMFGVGPEWIHIRENGIITNSVAGEVALDLMFWPSPKRRLGWYVEPAYDYAFGGSHDRAIGVSVGLLISVR